MAKQRLADTCGACHADPDFLSRHRIPFAKPVEAYRLSVHGRAVASGDEKAASCSDCHGSHAILPGRDPRSKINHWRVVETCGGCHEKVAADLLGERPRNRPPRAGSEGAPVCTDCHGEHTILAPAEPGSLVNPARVSSVTCGRCHGDERLAGRYNLPGDKVAGLRGQLPRPGPALGLADRGQLRVVPRRPQHPAVERPALHGPSRQPGAGPAGAAIPGAGQRFAIGPVHVRCRDRQRASGGALDPLDLPVADPGSRSASCSLHNALDFVAKLRARVRAPATARGSGAPHEPALPDRPLASWC